MQSLAAARAARERVDELGDCLRSAGALLPVPLPTAGQFRGSASDWTVHEENCAQETDPVAGFQEVLRPVTRCKAARLHKSALVIPIVHVFLVKIKCKLLFFRFDQRLSQAANAETPENVHTVAGLDDSGNERTAAAMLAPSVAKRNRGAGLPRLLAGVHGGASGHLPVERVLHDDDTATSKYPRMSKAQTASLPLEVSRFL